MTQTDLPRRAWSPEEVAEQLGIGYQTVLRSIRQGDIAAFKIGRYYRVPRAELDRLLGEEAS